MIGGGRWHVIWLVLWIAVTAYGLVSLGLVLRHGFRALWELWPPGPELPDASQPPGASRDRQRPRHVQVRATRS
jgi:hypothetical protein